MPAQPPELLLPFSVGTFAKRLAAGTIPPGPVLLDISSGEDYIGLTQLEVAGTGESRLKSNQTKGNQLVWTTGKLSKPQVTALLRAVSKNQVWLLPSTRPGNLGERGIRIAIRYKSRMWVRTFWLGELAGNAHWAAFHAAIQQIVDHLGQGKVLDWAS